MKHTPAPAPAGQPDLLTIQEVARLLRVDVSTVRRWIATRALDALPLPGSGQGKYRTYRIRRSEIDSLLGKTQRGGRHDT